MHAALAAEVWFHFSLDAMFGTRSSVLNLTFAP
jgi:hypothetical protein